MGNVTPPPYTPSTPPPINLAGQVDQQPIIDPLFLKSNDIILKELLVREFSKVGVDEKNDSLAHIEKKKLTATLVSAPINLILIVLFQTFHYSKVFLILLIIINFFVWLKFQRSGLTEFFVKEVKSRPAEKFADIIAPQLYDKCKNQKWMRIGIFVACTFLIPALLFLKPHIFYEDAPDGKYVRFYTDGLTDNSTLVIPDDIDGTPIKGIRGDVFNSTNLESITLPNTIDTIRGHAFEDCYYLHTINLPASLKYIGGHAFEDCYNLHTINLPANLKYIGGHAFDGCERLSNIEFPPTLRYIGGYAFNRCSNLEICHLPAQMDSIGGYAFNDCYGLNELVLPENLTEIRAYCFSATNITSVTIPASVRRIGEQAFSYSSLEQITFEKPSQLVRIGSRAFFGTYMSEVEIPPSVKEIRGSAFRSCDELRSAKIPADCEVAESAFKDSPTEVERY
ncbi:MAG: leucine-rich repeat domain-containing protein [Bacteroidales bacterium]|nr:leucine-rich repeat domain-containing protein [Bacteroidales bacterium]